ncbi:oligosaccharide flippase family protein [Microbulbifer sp. YPW16]|uniref:oligosaccharide flippase family protein n=1 Tax=Microbulbifer sp. YPW16 TaxID=2904242 RepID=UPI001E53A345|nr:oligosaccharide flippase family protein [Microbulbifer sp. YPW16]UHQ54876.1 oligosaccharide flippase family protein [Microbulbifer sp. YPW16]
MNCIKQRNITNPNILSTLFSKLMGLAALKAVSLPLMLASTVLLTRALEVESFGQYAFCVALIPLLSLPLSGGLNQLLTREVSKYAQKNRWGHFKGIINSSFHWVITGFLLVAGVYLILTWSSLSERAWWQFIPLVLLAVLLTSLKDIFESVLRGLKQPVYGSLPEQFIKPLALLAFITLFYFIDEIDVYTALWSTVAACLFSLLLAFYFWLKKKPKIERAIPATYERPIWLKAILPFSLISLTYTLNSNIGVVILGGIGADADAAALRVAERLVQIVSLPLLIVNSLIAPYFAEYWGNGDHKQLEKLSKYTARIALAFALPLGVLIFLFGEPLLGFVFGKEYSEISYIPLLIITLAQLVNVFMGSVGLLLSMSGHERYTLLGQFTALLVNITLCMLLIPPYGATGAALGIAASLITWNLLLGRLVKKHLKVSPGVI